MEHVRLGTSGLKVSPMALGLGLRGQADSAEAERLIRRAHDGGITFFDCANVYGLQDDRRNAGRSEEILGRALKPVRDDVVIASKVVSAVGPGPNDRGGSRYHIMREAERSLRRLDTDRIDVYLLHAYDTETPLEEQFRALDDLIRDGKVRYAGVCNYQSWQVDRALWTQSRINASPMVVVQNPYSLLDRSLEREMFPLVRDAGLGLMAYSPLAVGLLSGAYRRGETGPAGSPGAPREHGAGGTAMGDVSAGGDRRNLRGGLRCPDGREPWRADPAPDRRGPGRTGSGVGIGEPFRHVGQPRTQRTCEACCNQRRWGGEGFATVRA